MKSIFKLTTAALALVTFASCSNDLLGSDSAAEAGQTGKALVVEMEDLVDRASTRAAFVPNGTANQLYWQQGDQIQVYDEALLKHDDYNFVKKRGTFENFANDYVKTPAFAFTNDGTSSLTDQQWDNVKNQVWVEYTISPTVWNGIDKDIASTKGNEVKAYEFSAPMWGEATKTDEGVKVNLKYLTAMMRIELGQLPVDAPRIRVSAYADQACKNPLWITGSFKAVVSEDDEINPDAQLNSIKGGGSVANGNRMTISFDGYDADEWEAIRKDGGFVYLPLIAQEYGALVFEYSLDGGTTWEFMSKTKPFTAKRGTMIRTNIKEFEIAGSDIESVNALLEAKKDETGAIVVSTTQVTELDYATDGTPKNVIVIPAGMKAESLTLDLAGLDATAGLPFEIESADGKFAGDVIIDLSDGNIIAPANRNVYLNLPNSNVTVKGDFNQFSFGRFGTATQDGLIVKSIKFADVDEDNLDKGHAHTAALDIIPDYAAFVGGGSIEVGEGVAVRDIDLNKVGEKNETVKECTIKIDGTARNIMADVLVDPDYAVSIPANDKKSFHVLNTIEIGEKGIVTGTTIATAGDVKIAGDASASGTITTSWGDVELSGKAQTKAVTATNGKITVSGEATASGKLTAKGDITLSEDVVVNDVTSDEGNIVVSGKAKGKDLTATKGTITVSEDAVVDDLNAKGDITISGNSEVGSVTSAGNITISDKAKAPAAGANFTATGKESKITINTEGVINGKVTAPEVAVSSKAEVKNTTTTDKLSLTGTASLQNVTLNKKGTATINLDAEGEAIKGSLTLGGENKITLTQGYIFDITGADGELTFDKGEGFTAIASITATGLKFANASTWNGKKIGKDFTAKYAHQYPMTGCMLASWDFSAATTLLNDIDLNNQAWTPVEVKTAIAINGNKKTIKNVKVDASADNAGLFATLAAGASVKDLTIDGIAVTSTKGNVGALVGKTLGGATFNTVTVKNATLTGGEASDNIGGLVGSTSGVTGDIVRFVTVNIAATITGRYNLGGLLGAANVARANIKTSKVDNTTFKVVGIKDPVIGSKSDAKAGSVGMYVGTSNISVNSDAKNAGTDAIEGKRADLGFKANFEVVGTNDWYFYYGCSGNNDCGILTGGSYACGADTYTAGSAPATNAATTAAMTAKYHNYRLKYDVFK